MHYNCDSISMIYALGTKFLQEETQNFNPFASIFTYDPLGHLPAHNNSLEIDV